MGTLTQATIRTPVAFAGVGLHTGRQVNVRLLPGDADQGLVFKRVDLDGQPVIRALAENVTGAERETALGTDAYNIHTAEHLLAAIRVLEIDNLVIEIDGPEVPILDGSARLFWSHLQTAGRLELHRPAAVFQPREVMAVTRGDDILLYLPAPDLIVSYVLRYDHPAIGSQYRSFRVTPEGFETEIAPARTFGLQTELDALRDQKLIKGGSLKNAVVFGPHGALNEEGLRFPDEPVRHKILDLLGDTALAGVRLRGHLIGIRSGHYLNVQLMHKLRALMPLRVPGIQESFGKCDLGFDVNAIQRILPHRYPFLLVDKILGMESNRKVVGLKNVTVNEPFFNGHFPGRPVMPGVLIIEAMAQTGGVMLLARSENAGKLVYFMGLDDVKWRRPVVPGDQLVMVVEVLKLKERFGVLKGIAYVEGHVAAEATMKVTLVDQ